MHLSSRGHALVGDVLYEAQSRLPQVLTEVLHELARQQAPADASAQHSDSQAPVGFLLHAETIKFVHPIKKRPIFIKAPNLFFDAIDTLLPEVA